MRLSHVVGKPSCRVLKGDIMSLKPVSALFLLILLALACSSESSDPSEDAIQTAIAQTEAARPADTTVPTDPPRSTDTPVPDDTSMPTDTQEPTDTRIPTDIPTAIANNTPKPTTTLDLPATAEALGEDYATQAMILAFEIATSLDVLAEVLGLLADNPLLAFSEEAVDAVTLVAAEIYNTCGDLDELSAPPAFSAVHDEFLLACDSLKLAGASILVGLEDPLENITYLELGVEYMDAATTHIVAATELLPRN